MSATRSPASTTRAPRPPPWWRTPRRRPADPLRGACAHRYAQGAGLFPARRHPSLRAAPAGGPDSCRMRQTAALEAHWRYSISTAPSRATTRCCHSCGPACGGGPGGCRCCCGCCRRRRIYLFHATAAASRAASSTPRSAACRGAYLEHCAAQFVSRLLQRGVFAEALTAIETASPAGRHAVADVRQYRSIRAADRPRARFDADGLHPGALAPRTAGSMAGWPVPTAAGEEKRRCLQALLGAAATVARVRLRQQSRRFAAPAAGKPGLPRQWPCTPAAVEPGHRSAALVAAQRNLRHAC